MRVRELGNINSKSTLDKIAEKNTRMARLRSGSRTKDDHRAPWDPHHRQCIQDTMATMKQENQAKQLQISKISTENSQLKKRIIDLKLEIQKVKEKQYKKAQVDKLKQNLDKTERDLYIITIKHSKQDVELQRLKDENQTFQTELKQLNDTLKITRDHRNEF